MIKPNIPEKYRYFTFGIWENDQVGYFKPERYHGFIYRITNENTGMWYIGKKEFRGNWKLYTSSSKPLNETIVADGFENFQFEILSLHENEDSMKLSERQEINRAKRLYEGDIYNIN